MEIQTKSDRFHTTNNTNIKNETEITFHPSVQESLKNIVVNEGYTSHQIYKREVSTNGGNVLGKVYEIDIRGESKDGSKETNIFLKHKIIFSETMKEILDINICYLHEMFMYTELATIFNAIQDNVNIPEKERFNIVKSYYGCDANAVILENISRKGFETLNKLDVMPIKFAEISVAQLAKFHALSFVLKYKNREYFEKIIETLKFSLNFGEVWKHVVKSQFDISIIYFDSDTQKKIENFRHLFYEIFPKYLKGDTKFVKCITHGDFRLNNIMVKGNDEDYQEAFVIDYQFLFYCSPVMDLLYLIFTGTDRNFRKVNMNYLKNLYHKTLTKFLIYFDLDVNEVYPKIVFEKDFDEALDYGLMTGLYFLPSIFTAEGEIPDFSTVNEENMKFKPDDKFKDRITEIVEDYIEWGILK